MEIALPDDGVYGIVDHRAQGCVDTCGFATIKLKLKNITAGEDMSNGTFFAVAKFRRNTCYQSDLSGQPGGDHFADYDACRGQSEEIVVSNPVWLTALPQDTQLPFTFNFPTPIPINASDLSLQVVFRGTMGSEADAVAVVTKDIAEPSFIASSNDTDAVYTFSDNKYHLVPYANYPTPDVAKALKIKLGKSSTVVAQIEQLTVGQHAQLAYLADKGATQVEYAYASAFYTAYSPLIFDLPNMEFFTLPVSHQYVSNMPLRKYRGIYRQTNLFETFPADATLHLCPDSGEYCAQTTLPNLSPAAAVSWTINF